MDDRTRTRIAITQVARSLIADGHMGISVSDVSGDSSDIWIDGPGWTKDQVDAANATHRPTWTIDIVMDGVPLEIIVQTRS